jgi:hypothetical protein
MRRRARDTYRSWHVGRLRIQAADILSKGFGFYVDPTDIKPVTGSYRTCPYHDVYRWELFTKKPDGIPVVCGCWETLTAFVKVAKKDGFHVTKDDEIHAGKGN